MMNDQDSPSAAKLFQFYYAATALFLVLDYFLGVNLRLAALDSLPGWRAAYYLLCFTCLGLMVWRPAWSLWVTTVESLLTLSLLIIAMGARVMTVSDSMLNGDGGFVTGEEIFNFVLCGGAAWIAYLRGSMAIQDRFRQR